jgi:hypothetical protein
MGLFWLTQTCIHDGDDRNNKPKRERQRDREKKRGVF